MADGDSHSRRHHSSSGWLARQTATAVVGASGLTPAFAVNLTR